MDVDWSDDELRDFVRSIIDFSWEEGAVQPRYAEFEAAAMQHLVPPVQEALRASGVKNPNGPGIAFLARRLLDVNAMQSKYIDWVMISDAPWATLTDWVTVELLKIHKRAQKLEQRRTALTLQPDA